ncbi:hypothetical protein [Scytonema millei]|nr:hypothetical protein [Scytonema millei]
MVRRTHPSFFLGSREQGVGSRGERSGAILATSHSSLVTDN